MRIKRFYASMLCGGLLIPSLKAYGQQEQPNIIVIMCDDLGYADVGCYGQEYINTPNLDRIAEDGVRFTNSFVANSLSGPSRACMITGKHSHANGFTDITQWNDRYECTTGMMGKLPDVNTENPEFQYYYMKYVNDLIACGARGFRYDTAKHIGLPSDPTDAKSERNNFWDIATGREAIKDITLLYPDSLFIYGEVLQDKNVKELEFGMGSEDFSALSYLLKSH